jgi:two-component system chemotaxis response regulator CheB
MIKVLVCEDSVPVSQLLVGLINNVAGEAKLLVVGVAGNGNEAIELNRRLRPDVIAMDVRMPVLNGLEATRRIMAEQPTPIVLVSEIAETEVALSLEALAAGALLVMPKPHGPGHPDFAAEAEKLRQNLCLMAGVKVVRHWLPGSTKQAQAQPRSVLPVTLTTPTPKRPTSPHTSTFFNEQQRLVTIGASTGGPAALASILSKLPPSFSWPMLITQHIMPGFGKGLVQWLNQISERRVVLATEGMLVEVDSGLTILAPDDCHLCLDATQHLVFGKNGPVNGLASSVDVMFSSIASNLAGSSVVGVLLTGMGRDGATGLKQLRESGATTIVQDEASSVVFGMPKEAIALGAAQHVVPISKIPEMLIKLKERPN